MNSTLDRSVPRCVIVDDHEVVRTGTRMSLESVDWVDVAGEASTIGTGLEVIRRVEPELALLDILLPDGDGIEMAHRIREEGLPTRVVLYSGSATTQQAERSLEQGVAGFVLKGSPVSTMLNALQAALEGRRYLDPGIAADMLSPRGDGPALSRRELQILQMMAEGGQNASIAFELGISTETVKAHVSNILGKLAADSRTHAVTIGMRQGLIT